MSRMRFMTSPELPSDEECLVPEEPEEADAEADAPAAPAVPAMPDDPVDLERPVEADALISDAPVAVTDDSSRGTDPRTCSRARATTSSARRAWVASRSSRRVEPSYVPEVEGPWSWEREKSRPPALADDWLSAEAAV